MGQKDGSSWQCWRRTIYTQQDLCRLLAADSGWETLRSYYLTSIEGQDTIVSLPYSEGQYIGHCAWACVKWSWLCWNSNMHFSHWWYVAVPKYRWLFWCQNLLAEFGEIYVSQDRPWNIRNVLYGVRWFCGASELCLLSTTSANCILVSRSLQVCLRECGV